MSRPAALSVGIAGWLVSLVAVVSYPAEGEETIFTDETTSVGLVFQHDTGATGERLFPEAFGAGAALVDFDNDGDLDVYLVQGGTLRPDRSRPPASPPPMGDRLFRNDIDRGSGLRFVDVTEEAGIRALGYGMGVATGDYDRDGYADLYVTNFGVNQLWHNRGDGTFAEVAAQAGVNAGGWSVAAAFFDYDRDGWPDLYVGSYTDYTVTGNRPCKAPAGYLDYCSPLSYRPAPTASFATSATAPFSTPRPPSVSTPPSATGWASRWPTSTTTVGSTCTWPMTRWRINSGSTAAAGASRRRRSPTAAQSAPTASLKPRWASMPQTSTMMATSTSS